MRSASVKLLDAPAVYDLKWNPAVQCDIRSNHREISERRVEVALSIDMTAEIGDRPMLELSIEQVAIVQLANDVPEAAKQKLFKVAMPEMLFPYIRENIDNLVTRSDLPPLRMSPVNFDQLVQAYQNSQTVERSSMGKDASGKDVLN